MTSHNGLENNANSSENDAKSYHGSTDSFATPLLEKATPDYLQELLKDKKQLQNYPNVFKHLDIILEKG
ncbi:hypothetical protein Ciccas_002641 [Cichlidogyrus casuarinus]|uniref:STAR protein homodimerisation region domain-containing protein n=1 Tax=Cichlidogyrus casuarinus TaxID=1844966 RepID=A0ABD2QH12_9PLAT